QAPPSCGFPRLGSRGRGWLQPSDFLQKVGPEEFVLAAPSRYMSSMQEELGLERPAPPAASRTRWGASAPHRPSRPRSLATTPDGPTRWPSPDARGVCLDESQPAASRDEVLRDRPFHHRNRPEHHPVFPGGDLRRDARPPDGGHGRRVDLPRVAALLVHPPRRGGRVELQPPAHVPPPR